MNTTTPSPVITVRPLVWTMDGYLHIAKTVHGLFIGHVEYSQKTGVSVSAEILKIYPQAFTFASIEVAKVAVQTAWDVFIRATITVERTFPVLSWTPRQRVIPHFDVGSHYEWRSKVKGIGTYVIEVRDPRQMSGWIVYLDGEPHPSRVAECLSSLDESMAYAQADYEKRLSAVLDGGAS